MWEALVVLSYRMATLAGYEIKKGYDRDQRVCFWPWIQPVNATH